MSTLNNQVMAVTFEKCRNGVLKVWPLLPAILYLVGFQIIVLVYLLLLSFSSPHGNGAVPSLSSYSLILSDRQFREALFNTTLFTIVGTPLELLAGLVFAALLYRSFMLRNVIRSLFLIPLALPALVTAMLIYVLFDYPGGHVNHFLLGNYPPFPGVIAEPICWRASPFTALLLSLIGKVWRDTPISMLIILAGLNSIDPELLDAAKSMGASLRQRFFRIIVPLIIPSISVVVLLRSVEMWKEFIFPFVLAGRYPFLGTLIDFYYNETGNPHHAAAVAVIMVICIVGTTLVLYKLLDLLKRYAVHP
ncbi:MAG: sugar ABC transporter permease [Chitinispirillaceae bacterium]|nr:sugar ABC transporter permease [Chitinispirillaceae bacterium]